MDAAAIAAISSVATAATGAFAWFGKAAYERAKAKPEAGASAAASGGKGESLGGALQANVLLIQRQLDILEPLIRELLEQSRDLHKWHARTNDDGVPVWYVSTEHNRALREISKAITQQTEILRFLTDDQVEAAKARQLAAAERERILREVKGR